MIASDSRWHCGQVIRDVSSIASMLRLPSHPRAAGDYWPGSNGCFASESACRAARAEFGIRVPAARA